MIMKRHFLFFLLLAFFVFSFANNSFSQSKRKLQKEKIELEKVSKEIIQKKKKLKEVEAKEAKVIATLNEIEKQLLQENKEYNEISRRIKKIQQEIRKSRLEIERLNKELRVKEHYLAIRLQAVYKYYRRSGLRILLSSATYNDFLKQEKFLSEIVLLDHKLFSSCLSNLEKTKSYEKQLNDKKDELVTAKKNLSKKRNLIKQARGNKVAFLAKVKHEKSLQIKALKELEEYSRELQAVVDRLPGETLAYIPKGKKFSSMKGHLAFPVNGKIISTFGRKEHPELHTFTFQKGIEIKAATGTAIKAIHDGRVVFADWFKGFGYMIIVDHGDSYYSLSAHASELLKKVDDTVRAGETIALVGDTSSIKGSCLYFEIRHHGKPQNPLAWFKK